MVDKPSCKICHSSKDTVIKSLTALDVKPKRFMKGKGYYMCDLLLPKPTDCEDASRRDLKHKKPHLNN